MYCAKFGLELSFRHWFCLWKFYVMTMFFIGSGTTVWFLFGGLRDLRRLFRALGDDKRNYDDDGRVVDGHNAGESPAL